MRSDRRVRLLTAACVTFMAIVAIGAVSLHLRNFPLSLLLTSRVTNAVMALLVLSGSFARYRPEGRAAHEDLVWTQLLRGVRTLTLGVLLAQSLSLAEGTSHAWANTAGELIYGVYSLLAAGFFYQGMVHWNRGKTQGADPGDWLNGISAVLVVASACNVILPAMDEPVRVLSGWQHQAALISLGVVVVLVGTANSVAVIGGLSRDRRIWMVTVAMVMLAGPALAGVFSPLRSGPPSQGMAVTAMSLILLAASTRPGRETVPVPATSHATANGAIVVVSGALVMLILDGFSAQAHPLVTSYAAAAVLLVSTRLIGLVRELEQLVQTRRLALTDDLTGIANRRSLMITLERNVVQGIGLHLMLVDLNDFKLINDRYGHGAGDELLCQMATIFTGHLPRTSTLARLGGDEFAVLLPGASDAEALEVGRRLMETAAPQRVLNGRPMRVHASVGIASSHQQPATAAELLRQADTAMYRAKSSGSGLFVFDAQLDTNAIQQLELLEDLHEMLHEGSAQISQLQVFFQPQVHAATGVVTGAEALVRWQHPRLGLLAPDQFLPLVEENGLMGALTMRVMDGAVAQWERLRASGTPIRISVNLSTSCLANPGLIMLLDDVVARGVDPRSFVLEVTETSLMTDPETAIRTLHAIAARGFEVSIDDYGTGYSSLSYLSELPAGELKLDRTFIARLRTDDRTAAIVAATIEMAHWLGMRLVAEGVEDEETLSILRKLGCDETQGYLHGHAMPGSQFESWLQASALVVAN